MVINRSDHSENHRQAVQTLPGLGYGLFTVPLGLKSRLREAALVTLAQNLGCLGADFDVISRQVMALTDSQFRSQFSKPYRFFKPDLGPALMDFAQTCAEWVGGRSGEISLVSPAEIEANPDLTPSNLDAFWRCVRPDCEDVGRPHADVQFWDLARGTASEPFRSMDYDRRIKVWIPLAGCDEENSLRIVPGSHLEAVPFNSVMTPNGLRPDIDRLWLDNNEFICPIQNFDSGCIVFHDRLVHVGPKNRSRLIRISCEFTILVAD
jgi:Phytanoyl-CoA dioxygenase (PhyH)